MSEEETNRDRLIIIELNEFNRDLLRACCDRFELSSVRYLLGLRETQTKSRDRVQGEFLDPWSQWVSVHTEKSAQEHEIRHLGDVPPPELLQTWEELSRHGISSGVWGVLNGRRGNAPSCDFFLPDPWTFSERAEPRCLEFLVDLPRYLVKHRTNIRPLQVCRLLFGFSKILHNSAVCMSLFTQLPRVVLRALRDGLKEYIAYSYFEYLSTLEFLRMWRRSRPQVSFLFLNSMAHVQHYYWDFEDPANIARFKYSTQMLDSVLREVLKLNCEVVLYNAISQTSTNDEQTWTEYRPIDHAKFLKTLKAPFKSVEPLMTRDAIVLFDSVSDALETKTILQSLKIDGRPVMLVETYSGDPLRLFFRIELTSKISPRARLKWQGGELDFGSVVATVGTRTGRHVPEGCLYSSLDIFPADIENHKAMGYVRKHFVISPQS